MSNLAFGIIAIALAFLIFIIGKLIQNGFIIKDPITLDMLGFGYRGLPRWITTFIMLLFFCSLFFFWIAKEMVLLGIALIVIGLIIGSWVSKYNFKAPGYRPFIFETQLGGCMVVTIPFLFIVLGIYILMTN